MFNILSYKGNANQNYTEISFLLSQNGNHQEKKKQQKVLERIQGRRNPDILLVGM
jgi:UDP-N-acetyl-D-mannosaminuronic acid transferase (WecB/TagA/CpsF family)